VFTEFLLRDEPEAAKLSAKWQHDPARTLRPIRRGAVRAAKSALENAARKLFDRLVPKLVEPQAAAGSRSPRTTMTGFRTLRFWTLALRLLATALCGDAASAASRLAIVATDPIRESGLHEMLLVELPKAGGLELVERSAHFGVIGWKPNSTQYYQISAAESAPGETQPTPPP
jgi:glutamine synthetase adenylyltransferase